MRWEAALLCNHRPAGWTMGRLDQSPHAISIATEGAHPKRRNMAVLIDIPKYIQSPEMGGLEVVPTMVRLKRLHDRDCRIGDAEGRFGDSDLAIHSVLIAERERGFAIRPRSTKENQLPCDVIKGGTKTCDEVTKDQDRGKSFRQRRVLDCNDIFSSFRVVFGEDFIRVELIESLYLQCERVQVFFRPLSLQVGLEQTGREGHP
jgi:hypothetical protein